MTAPLKDLRPPLSPTRRRLSGVALLLIMALVVAFCIANFNKAFKPSDTVTLEASTVGNQLQKQSDVKIRGIIVGEVRSVQSDGQRATLELAIDPDAISTIPSNTEAMLVPKTLFGERFVSLSVPPSNGPVRPLREGDVITEDRTRNATETEQVLDNLLPVLTAVQPQKLSDTLGAISQALSGRGKELGDTLVQLNTYLEGMNPNLPNLTEDIRQLPAFADLYNQASPDLIASLNNLVTTSQTLVQQRAAFESTFRSVTSASDTTTNFLAQNRNNIISLSAEGRPVLGLLARYSSEFPCLFQQLTDLTPKINDVLRPDTGIQIDAELTITRGKYVPSDAPQYADKRGPRCYQIQGQGPQYPPGGPFQDGSAAPPASRSTTNAYANYPNLDQQSVTNTQNPVSGAAPATVPNVTSTQVTGESAPGRVDAANIGAPDTPNSPEERQLVTELTAMQMGVAPSAVPTFAPYLTAATLRGAPVSVR